MDLTSASKSFSIFIIRYYVQQRTISDANKGRTTTRMLESIVRLSQGEI